MYSMITVYIFIHFQAYFSELKPFLIPVIKIIANLISKVNYKLGNPLIWVFQNAQTVIDNRIESEVMKKFNKLNEFL
jgi:hypothetical protein